jgi:hypothetical protein
MLRTFQSFSVEYIPAFTINLDEDHQAEDNIASNLRDFYEPVIVDGVRIFTSVSGVDPQNTCNSVNASGLRVRKVLPLLDQEQRMDFSDVSESGVCNTVPGDAAHPFRKTFRGWLPIKNHPRHPIRQI